MLKFKDLEEFHYKINCILLNNDLEMDSNRYIRNPLIVEIESPKYDLDITNFGYGEKKMQMLYNKYIDQDKLNLFFELVKNGRRDSMYYFENNKKNKDGFNGEMDQYKRHFCNCLLEIVYVNKQDKFIIVWRGTEFLCKLSADLKLISELLKDIDKPITLVFLSGRQFKDVVYGVYKLNGWKIPKIKNEKNKISILNYKEKYFSENSEIASWKETKVVQEKYFKKIGGKQNGV